MLKKISLDYDFGLVLSADFETHSGSCLWHVPSENPDLYKQSQAPDSYGNSNTTIHQLWWDSTQLDFDEIGRQLGIDVITISSIRQDPGNVIPYHRDQFKKMSERFPTRTETKVRANIFLEHSKLGHILQFSVDDEIITAADWKQNQGYMFDSEVPHLSCNAGLEPKYTLQVSGFLVGS